MMKIITLKAEGGRASQPPQWFWFVVSYNSFSFPDDHGMNADVMKMAKQKTSIEIRKPGDSQA